LALILFPVLPDLVFKTILTDCASQTTKAFQQYSDKQILEPDTELEIASIPGKCVLRELTVEEDVAEKG
jgi:hypothetical protein